MWITKKRITSNQAPDRGVTVYTSLFFLVESFRSPYFLDATGWWVSKVFPKYWVDDLPNFQIRQTKIRHSNIQHVQFWLTPLGRMHSQAMACPLSPRFFSPAKSDRVNGVPTNWPPTNKNSSVSIDGRFNQTQDVSIPCSLHLPLGK